MRLPFFAVLAALFFVSAAPAATINYNTTGSTLSCNSVPGCSQNTTTSVTIGALTFTYNSGSGSGVVTPSIINLGNIVSTGTGTNVDITGLLLTINVNSTPPGAGGTLPNGALSGTISTNNSGATILFSPNNTTTAFGTLPGVVISGGGQSFTYQVLNPSLGVQAPTVGNPVGQTSIQGAVSDTSTTALSYNTTGSTLSCNGVAGCSQNTTTSVTVGGLTFTYNSGSGSGVVTPSIINLGNIVSTGTGANVDITGLLLTINVNSTPPGAGGTLPNGAVSGTISTNSSVATILFSPNNTTTAFGTLPGVVISGGGQSFTYQVLNPSLGVQAPTVGNPVGQTSIQGAVSANATSMNANAGTTPQAASINTTFANPLSVRVSDGGGNAVSGVNVTFTAPASGASGQFSNSTNTIVVPTNAAGNAAAPFTANATIGGAYTVTATSGGLPTVNFSLTNTATPATMTANAGTTPQTTTAGTTFATALGVIVKDGGNSPVAGVNVVFTAPASGASGLFSNSTRTITVATNASGVASAPFTANATVGGPYSVTAAATGLATVNFSLTNSAGASSSVSYNTTGSTLSCNSVSGCTQNTSTSVTIGGLTLTYNSGSGSGVVTPSIINLGNIVATGTGTNVNLSGLLMTINVNSTPPGAGGTLPNGAVSGSMSTNNSGASILFSPNNTTTGFGTLPGIVISGGAQSLTYQVLNPSLGLQAPTVGNPIGQTSIQGAVSSTGTSTMVANAGTTPQSATVNTAFANALAVTVQDAGSNPVPGVNVTFTAPASGASGLFSNSTTTITVATNASGIASAPFTANGTVGANYNVSATASGLATVTFTLTNAAVAVPAQAEPAPLLSGWTMLLFGAAIVLLGGVAVRRTRKRF